MKELSIEQKAKLYDEALERMKAWVKGEYPECFTEAQKAAEFIFPELKESEDEKIRKELIDFVKSRLAGFPKCDRFISWLEKQSERKPTDKVEPKFHEGEWVVYNHDICQIVKREEGCNKLVTVFGIEKELVNERNLSTAHLWTIQDAKDGDVLVGKIDGDDYILIFKQIKDGWIETYGHYYGAVDRVCVPSQLFCRDYKGTFYPTTKEQRDLLFSKMKEAGYEWDTEKKKLKKIDDEEVNGENYGIDGLWHAKRILEKTLGSVSGYQTDDGILDHKAAITAVKKLYEQKPTWTEEDEKRLNSCLIILQPKTLVGNTETMNTKWLKSLKERIGG